MFRKIMMTAACGLLGTTAAHADYRFEVGAGYGTGEIETGIGDADQENFNLFGTAYLDKVDDDKGPLGEAAFLDMASFFTLAYNNTDVDDNLIGGESDQYFGGGRFVTGGGHWIIQAAVSHLDPDNGSEADSYSVGGGKYLTDNTTLVVSYTRTDVDRGGDSDGVTAIIEHLFPLAGDSAIKVEGSYGYIDPDGGDDVDSYGLEGIWYLNRNIGIGASYTLIDANNERDDIGVFGQWFITDEIAITAGYAYSDFDDSDLESDAYTIEGIFRF
ncbi:MAG: putative porin [Pseudomonadota bacterium]